MIRLPHHLQESALTHLARAREAAACALGMLSSLERELEANPPQPTTQTLDLDEAKSRERDSYDEGKRREWQATLTFAREQTAKAIELENLVRETQQKVLHGTCGVRIA